MIWLHLSLLLVIMKVTYLTIQIYHLSICVRYLNGYAYHNLTHISWGLYIREKRSRNSTASPWRPNGLEINTNENIISTFGMNLEQAELIMVSRNGFPIPITHWWRYLAWPLFCSTEIYYELALLVIILVIPKWVKLLHYVHVNSTL